MSYTYVPGFLGHTSGPNGPITRVVMHGTVSGCHVGGAMENAHYFQSASSGGLAHYVVDPSAVVQCARENVTTWHAPPNHGSIGIELTDPQSGPGSRWRDSNHQAMLKVAAALVHDVCIRNAVPMSYADHNRLVMGRHGITTHNDVSLAYHQSDHTDPGPDFPMSAFIALVNGHSGGPPHQPPAPAPVPKQYPVLRIGSTGTGVRRLQFLLRISADGIYGQQTASSVSKFQSTVGITADGIAGPVTLHKIGW